MSRTSTTQWRRIVAIVRDQGQANNIPCALCHGARGPIDYRSTAQADRDARSNGEWWTLGQHRPLALSVDHIIPHAAGGPDTLANAQASHAICNSEAQAKGHSNKQRNKQAKPQTGYWHSLDGMGEPLPGRALPGQRTKTHVFRT